MRASIVACATLLCLVKPVLAQVASPAGAGPTSAMPPSPNAPAPAPWLQQPAPAPTLPPATGAVQPGYPYPPGYPSSPGYPYPPAYGYPSPSPYAPGYPPYPQGYSPYASPYPGYPPAYAQGPAPGYPPMAAVEPPPSPVPSGRWRLGATLVFVPQGTLSYTLKYRGEALVAYSGNTAATGGIAAQLQIGLFRYLYAGFTLQYLPSLSWKNPITQPSTGTNPYGGSAYEIDLLPQLGANIPVARRICFQVFAAPGYSFLSGSGLTISKALVDPGSTARGFLFQTGIGMNWSLGEHAFFDFRGTYQWGFQNNKVQSATTGQSADLEVHSQFLALQAGGGYWF